MTDLLQDVRYALRGLIRAPGFAAVAILTLALGIGANTAIFSLVYAVILKPLPFRDPGKLIVAWDTYQPQFPKLGVSPVEFEAWRQQTDLLQQTAWYRYVSKDLAMAGLNPEAFEVHAAIISPNLLPILGVSPEQGRGFAASEGPASVLLSHRMWRSRFGSDPKVAGKVVHLNDQVFTVAGVMPPDFRFPDWADVWLPQGPLMGDELTNPVRHALGFVARLAPGATLGQARARLEGISARLALARPKTSTGFGVGVSDMQEELTESVRPALLLLFGAVAVVLIIVCANIANLLLARASGRTREMAVRIALGAGAWRIVRQLLTESVVLSLLGAVAGLALAQASMILLAPVPPSLNGPVLGFLLLISIGNGVAFGLAPGLHSLRADLNGTFKSGPASSMRAALVILEVALAVTLVVGAGILAKSFWRMMRVDPGFGPRGVLTLRISVPPSHQRNDLFQRIETQARTLPGFESMATANALPLTGNRANSVRFSVPGSASINPDALPAAQYRTVSPDYFRAMRIPLRSGRAFTELDLNQPVAIVNETMARRYWPGKDAVGMKFITGPWGPNPAWSTIVGVAGDVKQFGLDAEPSMDLYVPGLVPSYLIVKTEGDPSAIANAVVREIHGIDPGLSVSEIRTMSDVLADSTRSRRWTMGLLATFAGLALVLALIGIYAVMSWTVAQRTREIGIRVALGARHGQVLRMVIAYAMKLSALGLGVGVAGALALRSVLASFVFDVSTADPVIYSSVALLMLSAALLACYLPARKASQVDPLIALRVG